MLRLALKGRDKQVQQLELNAAQQRQEVQPLREDLQRAKGETIACVMRPSTVLQTLGGKVKCKECISLRRQQA